MKQLSSYLGLLFLLVIISCSPEPTVNPPEPTPNEEDLSLFYISPSGNDTNSGHSPETPWKSLSMISSHDFDPGSKILLQAEKTHSGNFDFDENDGGDSQNPVIISTYGEGKATIDAGDDFGIYVLNSAGFKIENLIVKGSGKDSNENSGIHFYNDLDDDIKLTGINISNCEVYGFRDFGIAIGAKNGNSGFTEVLIEKNKVHDILDVGISSYGFFSSDKTGYSHSQIEVKQCEVYNISGYDKPQHSGNGILLSNVQNSLIDRSVVYNSGHGNTNCGGPVGIWYWDSDHVKIQNCEVYNMSSGSGCDGGGFDFDGGVTNGIMQYNYSHNNEGAGFMVGQFEGARPMHDVTVRYNISENDATTNGGSVYLFNGDLVMTDIYVYNNTLFINEQNTNSRSAAIKLLDWKKIEGNIHIMNNILYANNGADAVIVPDGYSASLQGNLYYSATNLNISYHGKNYGSLESFRDTGNEFYNESPAGVEGDPMLQNPGGGNIIGFGNNLSMLEAYKLSSNSPGIDAGINLKIDIGEYDFYKNTTIHNGKQDIGAHEI